MWINPFDFYSMQSEKQVQARMRLHKAGLLFVADILTRDSGRAREYGVPLLFVLCGFVKGPGSVSLEVVLVDPTLESIHS